jgi:hypothetical protein
MKLAVEDHGYQLHTKFYPVFMGGGNIIVDFYAVYEILIRYSAFIG